MRPDSPPRATQAPERDNAQAGRRRLMGRLAAGAASSLLGSFWPGQALSAPPAAQKPHFPFGPLPDPRPVPAWALHTNDGQATDLARLCRGRSTALQLMFTGCSATCPLQGALFAQAQSLLAGQGSGLQLLSVSIDPLSDDPAALAAWLKRFGAGPQWHAARPRLADRDALLAFFNRDALKAPPGADPHTTQVHLIDRQGRLVYRSPALPPPEQIASLLLRIHRGA